MLRVRESEWKEDDGSQKTIKPKKPKASPSEDVEKIDTTVRKKEETP